VIILTPKEMIRLAHVLIQVMVKPFSAKGPARLHSLDD
jgi:hypothetical protein